MIGFYSCCIVWYLKEVKCANLSLRSLEIDFHLKSKNDLIGTYHFMEILMVQKVQNPMKFRKIKFQTYIDFATNLN